MNTFNKWRQLTRVASDPRWWPFYLQRQFLSHRTRDRLSSIIAKHLRPKAKSNRTSLPDVAKRIAEIKGVGLSHLGQLLTPEQATEVHTYFQTKPVKDPYRSEGAAFLPDSPLRNPDSHIAHHLPRDVIQAPHLISIANNPDILCIIEAILGCKPTLSYLAAWWSYHTEKGAQQAEHFHRDVDDWRFIKLFIYLTDVTPDNGPHIYVLNSSSSTELREIRRFTNEEVNQVCGKECVIELTGHAGEGFLEDTFGIHKGQPVKEGQRLIFQAVYSMFPLPYAPKSPVISAREVVSSNKQHLDPWINRLYIKSE